MKFFNIDAHVSVIEDVATCLRQLGHEVESHLMSGTPWALGKKAADRGSGDPNHDGFVGYGGVNLATWEYDHSSSWEAPADGSALTKFAAEWPRECPELLEFDGYVACYPSYFAMLYEKMRSHIIVDMAVRFDLPFAPFNMPDRLRQFCDYLVRGVNSGRMTVVANSRYDALYYEWHTGQPALYVPSLCEYVDRFARKYDPRDGYFLAFGDQDACREAQAECYDVSYVRDALGNNYLHGDLARVRGIVWVPYTTSLMSLFEHYWLGIPLFVPSPSFLLSLRERGRALRTMSWYQRLDGSLLPRRGTDLPDPNTREGVEAWLPHHDYYSEELPHITYFDSWEHLRHLLSATDLAQVSREMLAHNNARKRRVMDSWRGVMRRVEAWRAR